MIQKKYYKLIRVSHEDEGYFRITNISNEVGTFSITRASGSYVQNLEYSTDGVNWTSWNFSTPPSITINPSANIYFKGNNPNGFGNGGNATYLTFNFDKNFKVGGNIMTMISTTISSLPNYCFYRLFMNNTNLVNVDEMNFGNVTGMGDYAIKEFFSGCQNLTSPPDLSNILSIGYCALDYCFKNCSNLTYGPDLSNVTSVGNYALEYCFQSCSKISTVTAPNISDLTVNNVLLQWLDGAGTQATGTKVVNVPTGATIATGVAWGIPLGWTRVDY